MSDRPPHFPDPDANALALLEAHNAELVEALADAHKEAKAWQAQLEAALTKMQAMSSRMYRAEMQLGWSSFDEVYKNEATSSNLGHG